ncbi:hypothetical protein ASG35_10265 [Burkholderia sp. Leaf177]|uniref:hypothetical protein n=1 Tax=Burkholderia sp. Leaf177 TaxID=1736287 RepID=UPI0006FA7437|nr:hypothetical protein [Burkholderia sp. Leaf177]KQR78764.1 hypothetical protein ASG35_10265 [Burkholderia sp. Leaf177]
MKMKLLGCALAALTLSACGGGGGGSDNSGGSNFVQPDTSGGVAQGFYSGTDNAGDIINGVVLDTGVYYFVYVNQTTNTLGLVQGTASRANGPLVSADARNYVIGQNSVTPDNIAFSLAAQTSLNGTITPVASGSTPVSFTTQYSTVYDQAPSLAAIAGTYTGAAGSVKGGESVSVTITANGAVSGRGTSGCIFTGTATPHGTKNVYDATVTFGAAPCLTPNKTLTGVLAVIDNSILAAAPLADRSDAFVLAGSK